MLEKLFGLSKKKTTVRTEVMASLATFLQWHISQW